MERCLQMTFVPQIEKGWNFFLWITDEAGRSLPFPESEQTNADLPICISAGSPYQLVPVTAAFITDDGTEKVRGRLITLTSGYDLVQTKLPFTANGWRAGETLRWFAQIAESVRVILAGGRFFPWLYHLERPDGEWSVFCQWIPDTDPLEASGLFSDWLNRLPELVFSLVDLQEERVRQWLQLTVIFWTNALIQQNLPDMATTLACADPSQCLASGKPFRHDQSAWMVTREPGLIQRITQLEADWAAWLRPVVGRNSASVAALMAFKNKQVETQFTPMRAQILLNPDNPEDPFSPETDWRYDVHICGWKKGQMIQLPLKELMRSPALGRSNWFAQQLDRLTGDLSPSLIRKLTSKPEGHLDAAEVDALYQETAAADQRIDLIFPENLDVEESSNDVLLNLDIAPAASLSTSLFGLQALINYNWRIAIGDVALDVTDFRQLVRENQSFIRYRNKWIHLPLREMRKAYDTIDQTLAYLDQKPSMAGALKLQAVQQHKRKKKIHLHVAEPVSNYLQQLLKKPTRAIPLPERFHGTLRPYQLKGYTWLVHLRRQAVGGCLADDMGLGKTVQAIAYLAFCSSQEKIKSPTGLLSGPALIICPTSLVANWHSEFTRFAPELTVYCHHGSKRLHDSALEKQLAGCDVMITSYTLYTKEADVLNTHYWQAVILDEAQAIKNPHAQKTRALKNIQGAHRIILTGTPIENHLEELWSLIDFLNPGYLGALEHFRRQFILPIEKKASRTRARELTDLIQPFLLRREKTDKTIISDLPDKFEEKRTAHLTKEQASLYQTIVNQLTENVQLATGIRRKGLILSTLTRLKQVCDHPQLVGSPLKRADASGKMALFYELLDPLFAANQKVLVFSQYVQMGKLLADQTKQLYPDASVFFLHGGLTGEKRQQLITQFQRSCDQKTLFVLSLKAGGVGINLTEAGYVIHYDRWWNPAVEEQATDRAYRIGQTKTIHVYKLLCAGTLEERIDQLIERKKQLQKQILGRGDAWLTELSDQEIVQLIQLREGSV